MTLDELGDMFEGARRTGDKIRARCRAHGSRGLTLSLAEGEDGNLLVHCFAGCEPEVVLASVGLRLSDLFAESRPDYDRRLPSFPPDPQAERLAADLRAQAARYHEDPVELCRARFRRFSWLTSDLDLLRARTIARLRGVPITASQLEARALTDHWDYARLREETEVLPWDLAERVLANVFTERVLGLLNGTQQLNAATEASEVRAG